MRFPSTRMAASPRSCSCDSMEPRFGPLDRISVVLMCDTINKNSVGQEKRMRIERGTVAASAAVLAGLLTVSGVAVASYIVDQLTRPQPEDPMADFTFTPWEMNVPWEDVSFPARGGTHDVVGW